MTIRVQPNDNPANKEQNETSQLSHTSNKRYCKVCKKVIFPNFQCVCAGAGSADESSDAAPSDDKDITQAFSSDLMTDATVNQDSMDQATLATTPSMYTIKDPSLELQDNDKSFDPYIISELLDQNLLLIDNNSEQGILTIKLLCEPNVLSQQQRHELQRYVDALLHALADFKKEHDISYPCSTLNKDSQGNILSLKIAIPIYSTYNAFIQRLTNQQLLPIQNTTYSLNKKIDDQEGKNLFNPTPFSTRPAPSTNAKTRTDEDATPRPRSAG